MFLHNRDDQNDSIEYWILDTKSGMSYTFVEQVSQQEIELEVDAGDDLIKRIDDTLAAVSLWLQLKSIVASRGDKDTLDWMENIRQTDQVFIANPIA